MPSSLNVPVTELARHLSDFLNRVAYRGDRFTVVRGKRPVASLEPVPAGQTLGELAEFLSTLHFLSKKEAAEFGADIENARKELDGKGMESRWDT